MDKKKIYLYVAMGMAAIGVTYMIYYYFKHGGGIESEPAASPGATANPQPVTVTATPQTPVQVSGGK